MEDQRQKADRPGKWEKWLKRIGVAGVLFFLIKGLIWLGILYFIGKSALGE